MKKVSFLLIGLFAAFAVQMSAATGQLKYSRSVGDSEVGRVVATSEERPGSNALKTRKVGNTQSSFIATPAGPSRISTTPAPMHAVAKSSQISPTLNIYGTVIYASDWTTSNAPYGVYHLPLTNESVKDIQFETINPIYSYFDGDHTVYSMYKIAYGSWVMGYDLYMYDTETKKVSDVIAFDDIPLGATDVAYDPTSGKAYGCFSGDYYGEAYRHWGYLDINARKVVKIADLEFSFRGVAIDKFGQAYGIDLEGNLYKINKETGELDLVGPTGCPELTYMSSAAYNDKDNNIILSFANDSEVLGGGIVAIDPETGVAELITTFADKAEVIGLYVPFQAPDKAPAAPEFAVACADGSMTVDFTLTMPTTLYDGTDAAGQEMGYKIYADGTEVAGGKATAGEKVEISRTLAVSGNTNFVAVATNEVGESNQAKASCYVGKGTPAATTGVNLEYADGTLTLTWEAVTESADGGYINAADIRYDVVDAEGTVVASDLTETTWSKAQAVPDAITGYTFGVVVKYDAKVSKTVMSNTIFLGHFTAPMQMDMSKKEVFDQHSVLDANKDGKTWIFHSSRGTIYDYSTSNKADDWIFSPAIYLEEGKAYDFEAIARAYSNGYPEKIEIFMGNAATAEAMTTALVEETTLGGDPSSLTAGITPAATGEYFIGFHAVSDAFMWNLFLTSYSISEPYSATAPDAVSDINPVPDVKGELTVAINFNAPSVTVTGAPYTGDMKLTILRNDEEVGEMTVAAGSAQTFNDAVPEIGTYTYTIVSRNMAGEKGRSASASVFVGPNEPQAPAAVKAVENAQKIGELTLTWDEPAGDIDGKPLFSDNLTYNVYMLEDNEWKLLNEAPIAERTFTFQAQAADAPQAFVQVGVQAINKGVKGQYLAGAGLIPVGPAYTLPVAISCFDDAKKYILGLDAWDGCEFGLKADGEMSAVTSQDGDGQFFYGERVRSSATLGYGKGIGDFIFGKIDLAGAEMPIFTLYTWKITETDQTKLEIIAVCDGESKTVTTIDYENDMHGLWTKKVVSLEEYKGKAIQLIIRYYSDGLVYCFFDNMKFMEMPAYDINAVEVTAPKSTVAGEPFEVKATVENVGRLAAGPFAVELLANGKVVDTKQVENLEAGASLEVVFEQSINMAQYKIVEYTAHVVYDADLDESNDTTPKGAVVIRETSTLPVVANLSGNAHEGYNTLTWDAITAEDLPYDVTVESFEDAEPFTKEYPGWTFVDRDGAPCGSLGNIDIPNHVGGTDPESFMVIDGTYSAFVNSEYGKEYRAADGKQYIGAFWAQGANYNDLVSCDDWAISPLLKGSAQKVTFCAKNASVNYKEFLQVWYATTDTTNPDDFEQLESFNNAGYAYRVIFTDGWGDFSFELPEGAVRFAFRVVSNDGIMLMIDKVSFLAADATVGLEHTGYNVYCDGVKLNAEPVTTNSYTHSGVAGGEHTYHVTALYNRGESETSEPLVLTTTTTGIDNINAEGASVAVEGHDIIVTAADETAVQIVTTDGKTIVATAGSTRATVASGLYLVTVGQTVTKVIVH